MIESETLGFVKWNQTFKQKLFVFVLQRQSEAVDNTAEIKIKLEQAKTKTATLQKNSRLILDLDIINLAKK